MGDSANHKETASSQRLSDWIKGLKPEFKKISWTDRRTLLKQTVAVTVISLIMGLLIALIDKVIQYGIHFLIG